MRIAQRSIRGMGIDELHFSLDGRQKARDIDPGPSKHSMEFWPPQDGLQFRKGLRTHDGDEATL